jgi:short subunit dehydrogenase-like uncharacterized protein
MTLRATGYRSGSFPPASPTASPDAELIARVRCMDPGYGSTAVIVVACALSLLFDRSSLPHKGGVYTPAIAFRGSALIERLRDGGVAIDVVSSA